MYKNMKNKNFKNIKIVSTTEARKNIADIVDSIRYDNCIYGIGRRKKIEALIIKFPEYINDEVNEITNVNANSASFDFLADEPDIYSVSDLKKRYV